VLVFPAAGSTPAQDLDALREELSSGHANLTADLARYVEKGAAVRFRVTEPLIATESADIRSVDSDLPISTASSELPVNITRRSALPFPKALAEFDRSEETPAPATLNDVAGWEELTAGAPRTRN
jgi:hypothetical protein